MKKLISILSILILNATAFADEGMWTMDQIHKLDLQNKGLKIPLEEVYNPDGVSLFNAIVSFGGGSSGFVSPNGLVLTNHHMAFRTVQRASTQGTDYLTHGFLANSLEEEIQAPGQSVMTIDEIRDVTSEVLATGKKIKNLVKRQAAIDKKIQTMTDAIEAGKVDVTARIAKMYEGKKYLLYKYKRFDDVRIVYMPPQAIGNYGGDIDNWVWPRHTGDFAFARVYVAPDGTGRTYHKDNVPFQPKKWLKISTRDLDDGDFTMIMGFPGGTQRYRTSHSVKYNREMFYPDWIERAGDVIAILEKAGEDSPEAAIAIQGMRKNIANYHKNRTGMIAAMDKFNFLQKTITSEQEFTEFVKSNRKLKKKYGKVLDDIGTLYNDQLANKKHDDVLEYIGRWGGTMPMIANTIYYTVKEREKPKSVRDPNYSEKDVQITVYRMPYRYMGFYEPVQKQLLKYFLEKAVKLPVNNRVKGIDKILSKNKMTAAEFVDFAFANTKLADVEYAKSLFELSSEKLIDLNDPLMNLAIAMYAENEVMRKQNEKFDAKIFDLRKKYLEVLQLMNDKTIYPDANGTIRFTYGDVEGYEPRDAVCYKSFTTLKGAYEKDTGVRPFDLPEKLKQLYLDRNYGQWTDPDLNDIPVAFTHTTDITGGNSGSPVLNAYGEMIGIAFDGNIEAMLGDWKFDQSINRTISVDIRYVMFVTEKYAGADYLLEEMGLKQ